MDAIRRTTGGLAAGILLALAFPSFAAAQQSLPIEAPTPVPTPSAASTPIPYPAYGTPAPDVSAQQAKPNVPTSISLTQSIDIAVMKSPAFASERAQYAAIFAKYADEKLALLPGISGTAIVQRDYGRSEATGSTPEPSGNMTTSISAQLQIQQLIFDGGRTIAAIRGAKEGNTAGRDTLLRQLQTLAYTVAQQYYDVLEDQATVLSDNQLAREFETQEDSVRQQIRTGAAARSALAAAEFQTAQARGNLITAQGALIGAQSTFATTLGLDADTAVTPQAIDKTAIGVKTLPYPAALNEALALRPDYLAALHSDESAKEGVRYAELARVPSIEANATASRAETLPPAPGLVPDLLPSQTLGATMTIPIFDQGVTEYNIAVAKSTRDEADAALTQTKLQVESDVRGSLAGLISARAALVQAQAEQQSALVNLQSTQATYKVGAATITDLVTADANLATAQAAYIAALYGEKLAEETYTYDLGISDLKL